MLAEIINQADKASRLVERATKAAAHVRGLRSGDRVYTPLVVSAEFSQGSAPSANLIFNVPADADFWAYRLLLYPYCKIVDPVNGTPDEVTFRSTSFTGESFSTGIVNPATHYTDFDTLVDGTFALIYQGKELQNVDIPMSAAYCANIGKWSPVTKASSDVAMWAAASQTSAGMVFDVPLFIPRTKSLTCRITPTYLGVRSRSDPAIIDEETLNILRQHRYKIAGVLEGEKKVTAFR